jgi:hypothetical protein
VGFLLTPGTPWSAWATLAWCVLALVLNVIQYAWTFFYLRLEEIGVPQVVPFVPPGAGPTAGPSGESREPEALPAVPRLRVVEGRPPREPGDG